MRNIFLILFSCFLFAFGVSAQDHSNGDNASNAEPDVHAEEGNGGKDFDMVEITLHHISDANEFHIFGDIHMPLPCFLYAPDQGWTVCMSSKFHHGEHAYNGYVLDHGRVKRVKPGQGFPMEGVVEIGGHAIHHKEVADEKGKTKEVGYFEYEDKTYDLENSSTADGGILGGGITSFYDFSITKNVFTMIFAAFLLIFLFTAVAKGYQRNEGKAPSGIQAFMEPFFLFIREEVCIPMIGKNYEKYQPFIMSLFFFILVLNLMGLIPFFPGSSNVTGNLAVTMALALFTFIITTINGNRHYWQHVFWMPGIPPAVKLILTPVEFLGLFIKPFSLMIRLFANITAGHIIILSLIGLMFVFGNNGENLGGAIGGGTIGILFTAFMNLIELIVALIQAFIFAILSASYIGAAIEDHHGHEEAH